MKVTWTGLSHNLISFLAKKKKSLCLWVLYDDAVGRGKSFAENDLVSPRFAVRRVARELLVDIQFGGNPHYQPD